jgi:type II restriction enzyme
MNNLHITEAHHLVTTLEARRSGFLEYALRRNKESIPFIDRAKALKAILEARTQHPRDILTLPTIRESLLEASGISVKAKAHLSEEDKTRLLHDFIEKVLIPCADAYIEEIIYRYLLTAGDALGGKMRNITGSIAKEKLIRFVISQLQVSGFKFSCLTRNFQALSGSEFSIDQIDHIKAIRWLGESGQKRLLIYDTNVPHVKKNIDIVLLADHLAAENVKSNDVKQLLEKENYYLAIGELKGGIDPAGADEHWKTANTALGRVKAAFQGKLPLCFVGAAIEQAMAAEIFAQYQSGELTNCANLTNDDQLAALCEWLVRL